MKKLLALILVAVLALGLFAGCQQDAANNDDTPGTTAAPVTPDDGGDDAGDAGDDTPAKTVVKFMAPANQGDKVNAETFEDTSIPQIREFRKMLDEAGVELEFDWIENASLANVITTRMASQMDLPDIIAWVDGCDSNLIKQWGEEGLLWDMEELLALYDADGSIKKFYDDQNVWGYGVAANGRRYSMHYIWNGGWYYDAETKVAAPDYHLFANLIRKDWVEAVGEEFKPIYTPEELYNLMKKMQDQDVNGNGAKDEMLCVNADGFWNGFAVAFGLNSDVLGYLLEDYKVTNNFTNPAFVDYITYMKKMYDDGLMLMTLGEASDATRDAAIAENRCIGYFNYNSEAYVDLVQGDAQATAWYSPIMLDMTGSFEDGFNWQSDNPANAICYDWEQWIVPKAATNPEGAVKYFDIIYTTEYGILESAGALGSGSALHDNTAIEYLSDPDGSTGLLWYIFGDVPFYPYSEYYEFVYRDAAYYEGKDIRQTPENAAEAYNWKMKIKKEYSQYATMYVQAIWGPETAEVAQFQADKATTLNTYIGELLVGLINGDKDIAQLDTYIAEMDSLGLTELQGLRQAQVNAWMGR